MLSLIITIYIVGLMYTLGKIFDRTGKYEHEMWAAVILWPFILGVMAE